MKSAAAVLLLAVGTTSALEYINKHNYSVALLGEDCSATRLCVNTELIADEFQIQWLNKDRYHAENGLFCHPTELKCRARYDDGTTCTSSEECKTRQCYALPSSSTEFRCFERFGISEGAECPTVSNPTHHVCENGAYCSTTNVCTSYGSEGDACTTTYTVVGTTQTYASDTCDPEDQQIYCQPQEPDSNTATNATGTCTKIDEAGSGESCEYYAYTYGIRPKCAYDQYCHIQPSVTTDIDTCQDQESDGDMCLYNTACKYGHICNKEDKGHFTTEGNYTEGICEEILTKELGELVSDGALCETNLVRDVSTGRCNYSSAGTVCTADSDCAQNATDSKMNTMYCNIGQFDATGTCQTWLPDDCETRYEDYTKYDAQGRKSGYLFNVRSCTDDGCFSLRSIYSQMRTSSIRLRCCMVRKQDDGNAFVVGDSDVYFMPRLLGFGFTGTWRFVQFSGDQEGDVCWALGMSTQTIAIICTIFGFLFVIMLFIIVKECILYKPEEKPQDEEVAEGADVPKQTSTEPVAA